MADVSNRRNSNIECLRIIAILMIVFHHCVVHGVIENPLLPNFYFWNNSLTLNRIITLLFAPGGSVGIGIFFLITGYYCYGFNSEKCMKKIQRLVLDVYFYAVIVGMCNMLLMLICKVSIVDFINSYIKSIVIPISGESWWFVTAYVFLLILADKINFIIGGLSKKQFTVVVLFFFVIYLVFSQTLSPFWNIERAIFYYLLGIYLKMDILKCKTGGGCLLAFGLSWLIKVFINYEIISFSVGDHAVNKLLFYAMCIIQEHICSTICVIMLFMFFLKKRELYIKFVNLIAKSTLFVYMLHDNDIVRKTFWNKLFANSSCLLTDKYFVIHVVGYSLIVYLICVLVWLVCDKLFYTSYLKLVGVINKLFKGMA